MTYRHLLLCIPCFNALACGVDNAGSGSVEVRVYGEEFVEEGIPAEEVDDGWAVQFDRFEVTIEELSLGGTKVPTFDPVDLTRPSDGEGHLLSRLELPVGRYVEPGFTIAKVHVVGSAQKGADTLTFDWTFDEPTHYHACETSTEVTRGDVSVFEITVHADHLLYDSLVSEAPSLVFQPLADADTGDGVITREELAQTDIGFLDRGNLPIDDLWSWLTAQVATLGHVDGEGHCHTGHTH
jgi:hypothetical protein